jgi:PadR family transcriptional regulator PadR
MRKLSVVNEQSEQEYMEPMILDNSQAQMRKGILEYCILLILSKDEASYTSSIITDLKNAHMIVVEGTLYPLLMRLKNQGLLKYRWEESTQGPPRKYYSLTDKGIALLRELDHSWQEMAASIDHIKGQAKNI